MTDSATYNPKGQKMNKKIQIIALNVVGLIAILAVSKFFNVPIFLVAITAVIGVVIYRMGKNKS